MRGLSGLAQPVPALPSEESIVRSTGSSPAQPPSAIPLTLRLNGREAAFAVEPEVTLLDLLRERAGLTGTKKGCDRGQCGACTVLVNGRRMLSCLALAVAHAGDEITTIEGLSQNGALHAVQAAFVEHDAFQCGFCTSGQILSAVAVIAEGRAQTENEIREAMSGNICRCGAYANIVAAVRALAGAR
ncbi:MAG: (2Fe-2S)-binding protein [Candidatus Eremiobacteraeota bacterium]|nr:(2Fe-2S)-binding protein [Candidatus Eremiobacteraeota bacterium]